MVADSRHYAGAADRTARRSDEPPSNSLQQHQTCWGVGYKGLRRQSRTSD